VCRAYRQKINTYTIFIGMSQEKRPLGNPGHLKRRDHLGILDIDGDIIEYA
jgi:hypothetical protein